MWLDSGSTTFVALDEFGCSLVMYGTITNILTEILNLYGLTSPQADGTADPIYVNL